MIKINKLCNIVIVCLCVIAFSVPVCALPFAVYPTIDESSTMTSVGDSSTVSTDIDDSTMTSVSSSVNRSAPLKSAATTFTISGADLITTTIGDIQFRTISGYSSVYGFVLSGYNLVFVPTGGVISGDSHGKVVCSDAVYINFSTINEVWNFLFSDDTTITYTINSLNSSSYSYKYFYQCFLYSTTNFDTYVGAEAEPFFNDKKYSLKQFYNITFDETGAPIYTTVNDGNDNTGDSGSSGSGDSGSSGSGDSGDSGSDNSKYGVTITDDDGVNLKETAETLLDFLTNFPEWFSWLPSGFTGQLITFFSLFVGLFVVMITLKIIHG